MFGAKSIDSIVRSFDRVKLQLDGAIEHHRAKAAWHSDAANNHLEEEKHHAGEAARAVRIRDKVANLIA